MDEKCVPWSFKTLYLKTNLLLCWGVYLSHLLSSVNESDIIRKGIKIPKKTMWQFWLFSFFLAWEKSIWEKFGFYLDKTKKVKLLDFS